MLFTIGDPDIYDPIIEETGKITKMGKKNDYKGGIVFTDINEARKQSLQTGYSIYILETNIENVYRNGQNLHLINSCIIKNKII